MAARFLKTASLVVLTTMASKGFASNIKCLQIFGDQAPKAVPSVAKLTDSSQAPDFHNVIGSSDAVLNRLRNQMFSKMTEQGKGPEALAKADYWPQVGRDALNKLKSIDPSYQALVSDPGIILHLDEFLKFLKKNGPIRDPWEARTAFREALGTVHMYRSMSLTDEELASLKKDGVFPAQMRTGLGPNDSQDLLDSGAASIMTDRVANDGDLRFTLSVTSYPELALVFASQSRKAIAGAKKSYLLTLNIHKLDLLSFSPIMPFPDHTLRGLPSEPTTHVGVKVLMRTGGAEEGWDRLLQAPYDGSIESIVFVGLPPESIVDIKQIDLAKLKGIELGTAWASWTEDGDGEELSLLRYDSEDLLKKLGLPTLVTSP